ncbi:MAG: aconitate hydratase AcnA [Anaerolineae bacterium]|nr:aconitate hydratase AcnA [Anaerolineae bacterium]MDW8071257.1 aconitate hydratase AcnA [Anaerolineae bacterium]
MASASHDPFGARVKFDTGQGDAWLYRLEVLEKRGLGAISRLPFSIKVLLEAVLRQCDGFTITEQDVVRLAAWDAHAPRPSEIPFRPARVLMQDFTGVPALVDLVAMRSAIARMGGNPEKVNPILPVDLVIDHSLQVDYFGSPDAMRRNVALEFQRNRERYIFLRWAQRAFRNFRVVPPASGIVHQVNLEYITPVVQLQRTTDGLVAFPDSCLGTDSHTPMINGLGVVGWGVGGIEAEAVMLGQPITLLMPEVVGFRLVGRLREGVTATDLTLTVTQLLRQKGVVGKFVEFCGEGLSQISLPDRATIANMAPDYGATMGFFPVDEESLRYLRATGRPEALITLVERYCKEQGLFRSDATPEPEFSETIELDLSQVEPSLAGPKRPQDRVPLAQLRRSFSQALRAPVEQRGYGLSEEALARGRIGSDGIGHGSVVLAAITSCTNTSNPSVMLAAGLLAKKAVEKGLRTPSYVKTSLAPGSRVVSAYLDKAGLTPYLEQLGFYTVGYGCTTCVGNSGPLPERVAQAIAERELVVAAVLSGNRNFEGRIHPAIKANYLASPPLVVAFALAGRVDIDLLNEPLGYDPAGQPVYLRDIWPSQCEITALMERVLSPEDFRRAYARIEHDNPLWNALPVPDSTVYEWDPNSTYIQEPPFFLAVTRAVPPIAPILGARVLVKAGDSVTTDHISPAGAIPVDSPAGQYLIQMGVPPAEFNSYGARRGNDRVMTRGTFANVRFKNQLAPDREGGWTTHLPSGAVMTIYDAAQRYQSEGIPLLVLAGKEYGTGSSRDWAAKGVALLGVRAVLAESFERIHRSNLVGMGVLPLQFQAGQSAESLNLSGHELYDIHLDAGLQPRQMVRVEVRDAQTGAVRAFEMLCRIDTPVELEYYRHGGILPMVLRTLLASER